MRIKKVAYLLLLFLGVLQVSFAQEKTVSGVVKDENLEPMLGASVIVKGTTKGFLRMRMVLTPSK